MFICFRCEVAMYAPIAIFCYNRKEHLIRTLNTLSENHDVENSDIHIFSDGPKTVKEKEYIDDLREYLHNDAPLDKFRSQTIYESMENKGLASSVITGVNLLFKEYEEIIVLEDDLVTSHNFIKFMNEALSFYKSDSRIWSISGYSFPIRIPKKYRQDLYLAYRASSWGWGTWRDRWEMTDWLVSDYKTFTFNPIKQLLFNRGGRDLSNMLKLQMNGKINSWAIRWCYSQFKHNKYTVYPIHSLVMNTGLDGSGTHSTENDFDLFVV